ncbi:hypothetical protein CEP54_005947 [Fusarium duplospermum]|uniref:Uncharacterized protein n=1 Tax=Fusarium duplospermum TaxID=1325734 RepID=A0A428Q9T4_9HYPO|nr:hypothetical protein CEP54_005947 [Fusarium duplospermum]
MDFKDVLTLRRVQIRAVKGECLVDGYSQELTEQEEGCKERTDDGRNDIYLPLVAVWHREVQVHRVLDRRDGWGWRWDVSTCGFSVAPAFAGRSPRESPE